MTNGLLPWLHARVRWRHAVLTDSAITEISAFVRHVQWTLTTRSVGFVRDVQW